MDLGRIELYQKLSKNPKGLQVYYRKLPEEAYGNDLIFYTKTNYQQIERADDGIQIAKSTYLIRHIYKNQEDDLTSWFNYKLGIERTASNEGITTEDDAFQNYYQDDYVTSEFENIDKEND